MSGYLFPIDQHAAERDAKPAALNGLQFLTASVLARPLQIELDQAHVSTRPGLGVEVDEQQVIDLMKRSGRDAC